jgi:P4 family phage/plasmid primase-like protien
MSEGNLNAFLKNRSTTNFPNATHTHSRIPGPTNKIYGGSYYIPNELLPTFYDLYYRHVFVNKNVEHLTETQLKEGCPMVVDFDFRYDEDIINRQHNSGHILDMICEYLEQLKKYYVFDETPFHLFIFEKPDIYYDQSKELKKDGIHMIIGFQVDHMIQLSIRDVMIQKLSDIWSDLPLKETWTWENVLDKGITNGTTNWQLYGSSKPENQAYQLTQYYTVHMDMNDREFQMEQQDVKKFDLKTRFPELSVQYDKNPKFEMSDFGLQEYNKKKQSINMKKTQTTMNIKLIPNPTENNDPDNSEEDEETETTKIQIKDITNQEILDKAIEHIIKQYEKNHEYEAIEAHKFAQILPEKYYEPGSHDLNVKLSFALKHTDDKLFLSWVKVRSRASDFNYSDIPELLQRWKKITGKIDGVTKRSILYWAKTENFEKYEEIKSETIDSYLEEAISTATEYDFAKVLKQMYKDNYVCINYKNQIWYKFKNHRWNLDTGISLRNKISTEVYKLLEKKQEFTGNLMHQINHTDDEDKRNYYTKRIGLINTVKLKLKKTSDKNNIMREASEIFYDADFDRKIDTNKYLLCFENGVIDFKTKCFRDGTPEDYISLSTGIHYIPIQEAEKETIQEIQRFMQQLFPVEDLRNYMWDHLASSLIGANKNHCFNLYHGSGSNGKSVLSDLMGQTLGEYKGLAPLSLLTDKRGKIGGTSDEILKLRGIRYAVTQEPSKSDKLNEGPMKELTGGDPIQARGLYKESIVFEPQFTLAVCTNNLFDIESNDDGTWRRIKKIDFISKFVDDLEEYNDETQYVFKKDPDLKEKFPIWAPVFAAMLIERAFQTNGIVEDCQTILQASKKYRNNQDSIASYVSSRIETTEDKTAKISKTNLVQDFKKWFMQEFGTKKPPKSQELYNCIEKRFKIQSVSNCWYGIAFIEQEEDGDDIGYLSNLSSHT